MSKKLTLLVFSFVFLFATSGYVFAQDSSIDNSDANVVITGEPGMEMEENVDTQAVDMTNENVDSFELFWPMVAGKVRGERFYSLKRLKEKFRVALIFGDAKKADYRIFLATKRVLESEKLLKDGKNDEAKESLQDALEELDRASKNVDEVSRKGQNFGESVHTMNSRLENISKLTTWLAKSYEEKLLFDVSQKASELSEKI